MTTGTASPRWLVRARYHWSHGADSTARLNGWWSTGPGRRYVSHVATGTAGASSLTVAYRGVPEGPHYALPHLFAQQERQCGGVTVTQAIESRSQRLDRPSDADVLVVGCSAAQAAALPQEWSIVLPFRINLRIDVDPDHAAMLKRVSGNERRQFAKQRRESGWAWEPSTDPDDLDFFYHRMHLPTMSSRHGEATRSVDWNTAVECLYRSGHLFFVSENDKRVAGVLCRWRPDTGTLTMRLLGVLDGDDTHYRSGAVKAVYYLIVEWACANGVRTIDLSGGEPFPGTGVYQFKRRLHPTVHVPHDHYGHKRLWLRVERDTPAVRDLLTATPMFAVDADGGLTAVYFGDRDRPICDRIRADGPGVTSVSNIDLDTFLG